MVCLKWTNKGQLTENTVYTFTWGIVGKIPGMRLLMLTRFRLTFTDWFGTMLQYMLRFPKATQDIHNSKTLHFFRFGHLFTFLILSVSIHVEDVIQLSEKTMQALRTFHLMKPVEFFMPPSGPLGGRFFTFQGLSLRL